MNDQPQFFSPKRKRMASVELMQSSHHHLNQSDLTEPGNISFQTVTSLGTNQPSSSSISSLTGLMMMTSNSASTAQDLSADQSRLYANAESLAMTQAHPSLANRHHNNSSSSSSHVQQTLFMSPVRTGHGGLALTSPMSSNNSMAASSCLPAALFSRTADRAHLKKPSASLSGSTSRSTGLSRVRANIFSKADDDDAVSPQRAHDEDDDLENDADLSGFAGWAEKDDEMIGDSDGDFLSRPKLDRLKPRRMASNRDEHDADEDEIKDYPANEHIERLLSESDTSMERLQGMNHSQQFPKQGIASANFSFFSKSLSRSGSFSERGSEKEPTAPLSPSHSSQSTLQQSQNSGFKTAVRRNSRSSVTMRDAQTQDKHAQADGSVSHHQWLTEHVSNFSRSCDLYATRVRETDDVVPCSPLKQPRRSVADFVGVSHQVLFPDPMGACTPVTERGSPLVLDDDIEYPGGADDSMMAMDTSYESKSSRGGHPHRQQPPSEWDHYSLFANEVINRPTQSYAYDYGPDSVEKPAAKVRRKSKVIDSPDAITHTVSDMSSTSMVGGYSGSAMALFTSFDQSAHTSGPPSFVSDNATTSTNARSHVPRPLPDLAAFDNAVSTKVNTSFEHLMSPVCPPTPSRTPATWHVSAAAHQHLVESSSSSSSSSSGSAKSVSLSIQPTSNFFSTITESVTPVDDFLSTANSMHGPPPLPPALTRQNSLHQNKLLASAQAGTPRGEVNFYRDFTIEGSLGSGAFAEVYKVRANSPFVTTPTVHEQDNEDQDEYSNEMAVSPGPQQSSSSTAELSAPRYYAVKKIKRQFRSHKDRDWLMSEVLVMKQVNSKPCPFIVPFVRAWQEDNHFFVQLGLAEKGTLKDLAHSFVAKKETIPTRTLWHVIHDVAAGLKHIHASKFVHLDIKPANILINARGILQIGDFGMASAIGSKDDSHEGDTR
jgi:hypothetical protein